MFIARLLTGRSIYTVSVFNVKFIMVQSDFAKAGGINHITTLWQINIVLVTKLVDEIKNFNGTMRKKIDQRKIYTVLNPVDILYPALIDDFLLRYGDSNYVITRVTISWYFGCVRFSMIFFIIWFRHYRFHKDLSASNELPIFEFQQLTSVYFFIIGRQHFGYFSSSVTIVSTSSSKLFFPKL